MVIRLARFNIYLPCLVLLAAVTGCVTPESQHDKQLAKLSLHLEVNPDPTELNEVVPIYRAHPTMITVQRTPFLGEKSLGGAKVIVDASGGFGLLIQFDGQGARLLEQYSAMNPGKRIAIHVEFGEKLTEQRWLAAPIIQRRISDGALSFTPDATRAEAEQIAQELNNVAIKEGKQEKPKAKSKKTG